jgi:DNA gyrase subunit A
MQGIRSSTEGVIVFDTAEDVVSVEHIGDDGENGENGNGG